ncbi:Bacterial extracellular solute-binding protein, family 3 [Pseudoalteromonas sp. P1-9]|nr:Bacterial extracellular solute-binding protein, family 3 [Pseudoalteromonas sp. P1-9]
MLRVLSLLLLVCSFTLTAKQIVVLSSEGPPHTINDAQNSGIDLDVVKAVLTRLGYDVKFHFVPLGRAETLVKSGAYVAMAPIFATSDEEGFYVSHPIVKYAPTVFSLKNNKLTPQYLSDLKGHSIITFQGAPGYFGKEFELLSKQSNYFESPSMKVIPELIKKERYDYAVLDKYIFYYFYRFVDKQRDLSLFKEHALIPSVTASAGFSDKSLRDEFNRELAIFLLDNGYRKVVEKYLGKLE